MRVHKIRSPIWKSQSVGIAARAITDGDNIIMITYKDRNGKRLFPNKYKMHSSLMVQYPTQVWKGVKLYIIPIESLEVARGLEHARV